MIAWLRKLTKGENSPHQKPELDTWHGIQVKGVYVSDEVSKFLIQNFEVGSWRYVHEQQGYFSVVTSVQFKNLEDAMAFKLTWG